MILLIVLLVGFSAPSFIGTEISGGIQVDLDITGGVPTQPFRIDVLPRSTTPTSATGITQTVAIQLIQ